MKVSNNKLFSYLGYSIKSRTIVFGYENIIESKKHVRLIIYNDELGENSQKKILKYAEEKKIPIYRVKSEFLLLYLGGRNCKCVGLTDENLASAAECELKTMEVVING